MMKEIIDGYEITITDETIVIRKDEKVRMIYYGTTANMVILRQMVNAVRTAEEE